MARVYKRVWDKDSSKQKKKTARGHFKGESWQVFWKGADGKDKSKSGFRTKEEAVAYGQKQDEIVARGQDNTTARRMRVEDLAREYMTFVDQRVTRDGIVARHGVNIKGHINNYLARNVFPRNPRGTHPPSFEKSLVGLKLADVGQARAVRFLDALNETKLDHGTIRGIITTAQARHPVQQKANAGFGGTRGARDRLLVPIINFVRAAHMSQAGALGSAPSPPASLADFGVTALDAPPRKLSHS